MTCRPRGFRLSVLPACCCIHLAPALVSVLVSVLVPVRTRASMTSDTWRHSKEGTKQDLEQATLKKQARRDGCLPEQGRGASRERDT